MQALFYGMLFVFGLIVGSFLNVVILRYRSEGFLFSYRMLRGRSHCPHCGKLLSAWELIPVVSYVGLLGKCRGCHTHISPQYPIVEFLSGVICVGIPLFLNAFYQVPNVLFVAGEAARWYYGFVFLWVLVFLAFLTLTVIDMREYLIPDELNLLIAGAGLGVAALLSVHASAIPVFHNSFLKHYALLIPSADSFLWNRMLGFAVGTIFFGIMHFGSRGRAMGMGDVKLIAALGILFGWPDTAIVILLSFVLGGVWGGVQLLQGAKGMKDKMPFGPFIVLGATTTFFLGYEIVALYFRIFSLV